MVYDGQTKIDAARGRTRVGERERERVERIYNHNSHIALISYQVAMNNPYIYIVQRTQKKKMVEYTI